MSSREITEWLAYDRDVEPIGDVREDLRIANMTAHIVRTMIALWGGKGSKTNELSVSDFVLRFQTQAEQEAEAEEERIHTPEYQESLANRIKAFFGGMART